MEKSIEFEARQDRLQWTGAFDTRIFSPLNVAGLCVTIGPIGYLFKRLTAVSAGRFYRFEHIMKRPAPGGLQHRISYSFPNLL
jgi:hypothetical protein